MLVIKSMLDGHEMCHPSTPDEATDILNCYADDETDPAGLYDDDKFLRLVNVPTCNAPC